MAKLIIHCQDSEGNQIDFVSSEHDGEEVINKYPSYKIWLAKSGLTQMKAKTSFSAPKKVWDFDGIHCPKCTKEVWDNRAKINSGQGNPKAPHFSCKDKTCGWAVWAKQYEIKMENTVVNTA